MTLNIDPELSPVITELESVFGGTSLDLSDLQQARAISAALTAQALEQVPFDPDVSIEEAWAEDNELGVRVKLDIYCPRQLSDRHPAILFIHGGGYVMGAAGQARPRLSHWCKTLNAVVVSVEYRLAPEHPFPAALHDCFVALSWLSQQDQRLRVDPQRIALVGESAGGGLAAGLALYARDHSAIKPALQVLVYPMLNHQNVAGDGSGTPEPPIWNRANNAFGWQAYLGGGVEAAQLAYAAPYSATDLSGLPPAFIPVGDLDLFLDENRDYAARLNQAGVTARQTTYAGAYHAFHILAPGAKVSAQCINDIQLALQQALNDPTT